jgi:hypothetical protein
MNRQEYNDKVAEIDFCEIEMVNKIQKFNTDILKNETLDGLCKKFFESESGLESIEIFESVVTEYHNILKGQEA